MRTLLLTLTSLLCVASLFAVPSSYAPCQAEGEDADSLHLGEVTDSLFEQMKSRLSEQSLPLVNLTVNLAQMDKNHYETGEIEIADYWRRTDSSAVSVRYHCKLRIRGNTSIFFDKKCFAVKLIDDDGENLNANILGIREENNWILDAMATDRLRMRNRVCFDVWNELSRIPYNTKFGNRNGTEGVFVEVFVNGAYHGLYCLTDKIDRKLLGLKKAEVSGDTVTVRGLLYKGIDWNEGHDLLSYTEVPTDQTTWNAWELQYPDDYPSADAWQPLMNLIGFCSSATTDDVFLEQYPSWFYPSNLLDYVVFTLAMNIGDNGYKNTFLSVVDINKGHRYMLSPWDMDMSLGARWDGSYNDDYACVGRYDGTAPFNRLMAQNMDAFKDSLVHRWESRCAALFSPDSICRRLEHYAQLFAASGAWTRELARWNGNPVPLREDIMEELDTVRILYGQNYNSLCEQLSTIPTDGIIDISMCQPYTTSSQGSPPVSYFDLQGRRLNGKPTKGLYIQNGRKQVVR